MDPIEALRQLTRAYMEIDEFRRIPYPNADQWEALANAGRVIVEHADAMTEWVSKGGFVPGDS